MVFEFQNNLNEALKQSGLEEVHLIIDRNQNGLAYPLFLRGLETFPAGYQISSPQTLREARDFFKQVEGYIDKADQFASEYGFKLVNTELGSVTKRAIEDDYWSAGIGSLQVRSQDEINQFVRMIRDKGDTLAEDYQGLREIAPKHY